MMTYSIESLNFAKISQFYVESLMLDHSVEIKIFKFGLHAINCSHPWRLSTEF